MNRKHLDCETRYYNNNNNNNNNCSLVFSMMIGSEYLYIPWSLVPLRRLMLYMTNANCGIHL
jgi:hypothetical protein